MKSKLLMPSILTATLVAGCQTIAPTPIDDVATTTGLQRVESSRLDALYVNPSVALGKYSKVLLQPVQISFRKGWQPAGYGTSVRLSAADMNRLKQDFEATFMDVFTRELQAGGSYELVSAPGPDVLEVRTEVTDLFIPAPDLSHYSPTRTRSFTREGSEMTLTAEVRDSQSGDVVSRAYDQRRASRSPTFEEANRLTNAVDARRIISTWATQLRSTFDTASETG